MKISEKLMLLAFVAVVLFGIPPLHAQENDENQKEEELDPDRFNRHLGVFHHRLRFSYGPGYSNVSPALLNEAGPSWMFNSFLRNQNHDTPLAIKLDKPKSVPMFSQHGGIEYSFRNQLDVRYENYRIGSSFGRGDPVTVTFFSPDSSRYNWAWYEGIRLLGYDEDRHTLEVSYAYPVMEWVKVGASVGYETYYENNNFTYGSYTKTNTDFEDPLLTTWSLGGSVDGMFRSKYAVPGIIAKVNVVKWLEIVGSVKAINRTGNLKIMGVQVLQETDHNDQVRYFPMVPIQFADVQDSGMRTQVEAVFRACRFAFHVGAINETINRKYNLYYGTYITETEHFNAKSDKIGLGEMIGEYPHNRWEIYMKFSVAFHSNTFINDPNAMFYD